MCVAGAPPDANDQNPCTDDSCDPVTGVAHTPTAAGTLCLDANVCNGGETCDGAGACQAGTPLVLDDANTCTADTCDPTLGVSHTPVAAGTDCSDADQCNGSEACDAAGTCTAGTPPTTDDGNPCTADACDPVTGVSHTALAAGTTCADADQCNGAETCNGAGACTSGTPPAVDDGNPCTVDACDPVTGVSHTPAAAGTTCADADVCNGAETCNATGACQPGTPLDVDDGNPCTADACDPLTGATHTPVATGTSCADADVCNGAETCDGTGACTAGTALDANDQNPCTDDACDPVNGITHTPSTAGTLCLDANVCNGSETCDGASACQSGTPLTLDDGNLCTADACDPTLGVSHTPVAPGTSCADADVCNGAETCDAAGTCASGTPLTVDDGNPCTADACDPINGVSHTPVTAGTSCTDADVCNGAETCDGTGTCTPGTPLELDDQNPCTADVCDPINGVSHTPMASGTSCADADVCNGAETCDGAGTCTPGTPLDLDDQNPCTADVCDPANGVSHTPVTAGTSCADANVCNGAETCDGAGTCTPGTPLDSNDQNPCTDDACDPVNGVTHTPSAAGTLCLDANVCDGSETCDGAGACQPGTPLPVDDDNLCTADACDPTLGIQHDPVSAGTSCSDYDQCNGAETCDATGVCQPGTPVPIDTTNPCSIGSCDPLTGVVTYNPTPAGTDCFLDACTLATCNGSGECTASGSNIEDDGDPCTIEWCDPVLGPQVKSCSAIDPTVGTTLHESMKWIYEQPNPVQVGVAPGTIVVERAALISGIVTARDSSVLPGVRVTILNHPEFGYTTSRVNGHFDMVVNGGGDPRGAIREARLPRRSTPDHDRVGRVRDRPQRRHDHVRPGGDANRLDEPIRSFPGCAR